MIAGELFSYDEMIHYSDLRDLSLDFNPNTNEKHLTRVIKKILRSLYVA